MPTWKDFYGSKIMSAKKLGNRKIKGKVLEVTVESLTGTDGVAKDRLCLTLASCSEKIPLNASNAEALAKAFGDNYTSWVGKQIEVSKHKTQFAGSPVDGLLVRPIGGKK